MLKLTKGFDKLFIDTDYIYDVCFFVGTDDYVTDSKGNSYKINNIVAVKRTVDDETEILFNIVCGDQYEQRHINEFENHEEMYEQIINHLDKHIEDAKYTEIERNKYE